MTQQFKDAVLADAPRGYWRYSEAATDGTVIVDQTGHGLTGVLHNPSGAIAKSAAGLISDEGASAYQKTIATIVDHIALPDDPLLNISGQALSFLFMAKATVPGDFGTIFRKLNGLGQVHYIIESASVMRLQLRLSGVEQAVSYSGPTPWDGTWHLHHVTWDGINVRFYINGVLKQTVALAGVLDPGSGRASMSFADVGAGGTAFVGSLSDMAVFASTLLPEQIAVHYKAATEYISQLNIQAILDATAKIAGGPAISPGKYAGAGIVSSAGDSVKFAYSRPPEAKHLDNDGLVHLSFWDGMAVTYAGSGWTVYTHRIRMQLMIALGRSDLPRAHAILTPFVTAYRDAFAAKMKLGMGSVQESHLEESPGIVDAMYEDRIALELVLVVVQKEGVNYIA